MVLEVPYADGRIALGRYFRIQISFPPLRSVVGQVVPLGAIAGEFSMGGEPPDGRAAWQMRQGQDSGHSCTVQ